MPLAHANANAIAVVLGLVLIGPHIAVVLAFRLAQEAAMHFDLIGHRAIQTARLDIQIDLILCLIRHDRHTCGFELSHGPFLLRAALQHANALALERGWVGICRTFFHDNRARGLVIAIREVNHALALFRDGQGADDHIVFTRLQTGNHAVPDLLHKHAIALHFCADGIGNVYIKPRGLTIGRLIRKGLVGGVNGHLQIRGLGRQRQCAANSNQGHVQHF